MLPESTPKHILSEVTGEGQAQTLPGRPLQRHPPVAVMDQRSTIAGQPAAASSGTAPPTPENLPTATARPQAFRRPHHKSRLGCVQCKQRKIKCDENKPSCDKCTRYNTPCSFLTLQPNRPSLEQSKSSQSGSSFPASHPSSRTSPYPPTSVIPQNPKEHPQFSMMDLEFLHHYTTNTWSTISSLPFWQTHVPHIATSYPFLMSSILALGAQHLAYLDPSRRDRLLHLSGKHHKVALLGYRSELTHITPKNCHALAAFSLLLNVYAWGGGNTLFMSEPSPSSSPAANGPEPAVELIAVLRGGNAVMAHAKQWVVEGPLAPLYKPWFGFNKDPDGFTRLPSVQSLLGRSEDGERLQQPILPHEDDARLEHLGRLWAARPQPPQQQQQQQAAQGYPSPHPTLPSPLSPASHASPYSAPHTFPPPLPSTSRSVLDHTLHMLRRVFVVVTTNEIIEPQAATLSWPIIIPDAYIAMISARNPHALVLLAHYTVLLKRNEERWWIRDKAEELLHKIYLELQRAPDGAEWIQWIQWPLGEVGAVRSSRAQSAGAQSQGASARSFGEGSPGSWKGDMPVSVYPTQGNAGLANSRENSREGSQAGSQVHTPVGYKQENVNVLMGGMEERIDPGMGEARMK